MPICNLAEQLSSTNPSQWNFERNSARNCTIFPLNCSGVFSSSQSVVGIGAFDGDCPSATPGSTEAIIMVTEHNLMLTPLMLIPPGSCCAEHISQYQVRPPGPPHNQHHGAVPFSRPGQPVLALTRCCSVTVSSDRC